MKETAFYNGFALKHSEELSFSHSFLPDGVRFDYSSVLVITTFLYKVRISNIHVPWSS